MQILETQRLRLREADENDAQFIYDLLTDKTFIDNIADKGVKNLDDARDYINKSLINSYQTNGFGLWLTEQKSDGAAVGLCGLVGREELDDPDVGYAFLPQYVGQGYATESGKAVMDYGKTTLKIERIVGITTAENPGSIKVLEKLGLRLQGPMDFKGEETLLFVP